MNWPEKCKAVRPFPAGSESHLQLGNHYVGTLAVHAFPLRKLINGSLQSNTPHTKHQRSAPQRVKFNDRRDLNPILRPVKPIAKPRCLGQDLQQLGI